MPDLWRDRGGESTEGSAVTKAEAEKLIETIRSLVAAPIAGQSLAPKLGGSPKAETIEVRAVSDEPPSNVELKLNADQIDKLYRIFKARFIDEAQIDPVLVNLMMTRPEIIVDVARRMMNLDGTTLKGRIARLIAGGFFAEPKTQGATRSELKRTGTDVNSGNLSTAFSDFVKDGFFERVGESFQAAAGVKITEKTLETS